MNYKKGLCFLLVLSLVLGSFPAGVLAEETGVQQAAHTENETVTAGDEAQAEMPKDALPMDEADGTALPDRQLETAAQETTPAADFTYREEADGSVTITGYTGQATTIVFPADIGGKPVKKVGGLSNNKTITSVVIPEGVETIASYAFNNCSALSEVELPSTITKFEDYFGGSSGAFSGCALTNLDGFSKLTKIKGNLFFDNNQIIDVSGIKTIEFEDADSMEVSGYIYLNDNPELSNIESLKEIKGLKELNVQVTKVTEKMAFDVSNIQYDNVETNIFNTQVNVVPKGRNVVYGEKLPYYPFGEETLPLQGYHDRENISVKVKDENIATFRGFNLGSAIIFDVHNIGETEIVVRFDFDGSDYIEYPCMIAIKDKEKTPDAGQPVENLPSLNIEEHFTNNGVYQLNLQDDGTLYNVTGGESQPIMENVKAITTSQRSLNNADYTDILFAQDTNDSLWIQKDMSQNPVKVSDSVNKYVGNNAYAIVKTDGSFESANFINYQNDAWAWILHKDGTVDWMDSSGNIELQSIKDVKDIANLMDTSDDSGWYIAGMLALTNSNELWYRAGLSDTEYIKLANNVASIEPNMYFIDTSGQRHRITVEITKNNVLSVTETVDDTLARYKINSVYFYVTTEGSWYQSEGQEAVKIGEMQIAEKPEVNYFGAGAPVYYFKDANNTLWSFDPQNDTEKTKRLSDNVIKFLKGYGYGNIASLYLREDHVMVNVDTGEETAGVKDIAGEIYNVFMSPNRESLYHRGPYILYEDGRLFYNSIEIMNGVESINITDNNYEVAGNNYEVAGQTTVVQNAYILRTDGTIWVHDLNNPTVVTKLADYTPVVSLGDIDGDGEVNASDALLALRHSVREINLKDNPPAEFPAGAFERANVTFDAEVNASDALQILRYSVKEITEFKRPEAAEA